MNINKIILSAASVAAMTLVACGSDSSNSAPSATLPENGRVKTGIEVNNYLCSTTENQCEKIFVEDINVTMQCGSMGNGLLRSWTNPSKVVAAVGPATHRAVPLERPAMGRRLLLASSFKMANAKKCKPRIWLL